MSTQFLLSLFAASGSRKRTNRSLCDSVLFLVIIFIVIVVWGSCFDKTILVTAAPVGRRAAHVPLSPTKSSGGNGGASKSCPEEDVGAKTYLAQSVFEGKARSRSPVRDGVYNVTFVVQHVYKGVEPGFLRSQVRLQFAEKSVKCSNEDNKSGGGVVRANIKRGGKYIVFVDKIEQHIFKAHGEPAKRSEKNLRAVKDLLCHDCGK